VADKVGGVYIEIQARMGSLEKDLRNIQSRMQQVDNTGSKLSGTITTLGKYLSAGAVAAGIYQIGKASLSAAAQMEQQKVAFTTMLGSAEKAKTLLAEMQAFAASTPFELNEIVDASKKLISFGISAEDVQEKLRAIGDVASGLGIPLGELSEIYGKARVQGTLFAEDLNQLAGRGIPIFEELGKVMNVDASQVKKLGSEGKISFDMLDQVFQNLTKDGGKFAGLMDAQSKTLAGKWSNFNDQISKSALLLGNELAPTAKALLTIFSQLAEKYTTAVEQAQKLKELEVERLNAAGKFGDAQLLQNGYVAFFLNNISGVTEQEIKLAEVEAYRAKLLAVISEYQRGNKNITEAQYETAKKVYELTGKSLPKEKKETEKKPTAAGAGESPWKKRQAEAQKYFETLKTINTSTDDPVKKVEQEIAALNEGMNKVSDMYKNGEIKKKQYEETLASYTEARIKKEEELEQSKFDRMVEYYNLGVSTLTGFSGQINELASMYASNQTTRIEQEAQKRTDALNAEYENQVAIIDASAASDSQKAEQKKALDEQLARDTKAISDKAEKDKRKAQRESAKISKQLAIFDTLITTPQAAIDSYTSLAKIPVVGPALGAAAAAAATALGLAKLKLIQDQPLPALAEGGIVPAIPGGRQITVAEGGNSEGVIPFNDRGVDILAQAMEKAISKIGRGGGTTNVYIDSELIYSNMYEASRRGAVKIDQRAIV
jgi:tape measure domain-containing protein